MDVQVSMPPPPPPPPPPPFFAEVTTPQLTVPPPPPPPQQTVTTTTASVATPATQDRIWLHPWTVTEMRDNASQWSLAGDAGVLLYLEQFSDKLIQRADAIQQHVSQTVNAVKSTHIRVQNCLNEFTTLANTQFIENRVYDEDETANSATTASKKDESSTDKTNVNNSEAQEKVLQRYVEAIQYGLAILDTHFERVEAKLDTMHNGGSSFVEDEDDGGIPLEPILEPKDPYILRPLPYLIGTAEFMQDDYVGLGDLLIIHEEEPYNGELIKTEESDSVLSDSDDEEEEEEEGENPLQAQISPAPIVPAGASRPDLANRPPPPTNTQLTDSEDDDDIFGIKTIPKLNDFTSKPHEDDNSFDEPKLPTKPQNTGFDSDSENEGNSSFDNPMQRPPVNKKKIDDSDNESTASKDSNESEKPQQTAATPTLSSEKKVLSPLEEAVLKRRAKMEGTTPSFVSNTETKPSFVSNTETKPSSEEPSSSTISLLTTQPLTKSTKNTKPSMFGNHDEDEDDELFSDAPKLPTVSTPSTTMSDTKPSFKTPTKEKSLFDDDADDEDDPFSFKKKNTISSPIPTKPNDSNSTIQAIVLNKPRPIVTHDESGDDDDLFVTKKPLPTSKQTSNVSTSIVIEKTKSPSSEDDLFPTPTTTKTQPLSTTKVSDDDDEEPLFTGQRPVQQVVSSPAPPVSVLPVKNSIPIGGDDSGDEIFATPKKPLQAPTTGTQKIVSPTKSDDEDGLFNKPPTKLTVLPTETRKVIPPANSDDEDGLFNKPPTKPTVLPTETRKVIPSTNSDDEDGLFNKPPPKSNVLPTGTRKVIPSGNSDDELFPSNPLQVPLPPPVVLPPLPSKPSGETDDFVDPLLGIRKPAESKAQPPPIVEPVKTSSVSTKKNLFDDDDEDEDSSPKREINKSAVKDGEKPDVKSLASRLKINPGALKPGMNKPSTRPKADSITEEPPKPSPVDDQSTENIAPPSAITKKLPTLNLDDDDDDDGLFNDKKKAVATTPIVEKKDKANNENETGKTSIKDLSSRLKINPMMMMPGAHPKSSSNEDNESNSTTQKSSSEASKEEPTADKAMLDMFKDRAKLSVKTRTPPTRKPRSAGATASATSTNETDDLFGLSSSKSTATSLPPPAAAAPTVVPVIPPPSVAVPPPVPVTGLPDKPAAIATLAAKQTNSKEKKKFSLFDSDDSDIDELLFGFNKKNKSPVVSKPTTTPSKTTTTTTTKVATKSSILPLEDDDSDFLSKRPVKKGTKPVDNDDIFADVKTKTPQANKAKKDWSIMNKPGTEQTDDIFNDTLIKSSTAAKPKATNVKNKSTKDIDDIFDDPLNISSKR